MAMQQAEEQLSKKVKLPELEGRIELALKKINGKKENDICKYLPCNGGYMHHFTLRKLKSEEPQELCKMIDEYIMRVDRPQRVPHKPRRPRGSRKRPDLISLTRDELNRILGHVREAGEYELAAKFSLKGSRQAIKKALLASIRQDRTDWELWNAYVEASRPEEADASDAENTSAMVQVSTQ